MDVGHLVGRSRFAAACGDEERFSLVRTSTVQTFKIVGILALPLIAILATVLFLFYGQSGDDSAGAAGGVGMSLKFTSPDKSQVITSTEVGSKFAILVVTDPAPDIAEPGGRWWLRLWRSDPGGRRDQVQRAG